MRDNSGHEPWDPASRHPRVLIECPASASPSIVAQDVERLGFAVRTCVGPQDRGGCDLIDKGVCSLVSGADVVVNMLHSEDPSAQSVLGAVMGERRPPATVVELTPARIAATGLGAGEHIGPPQPTVITTPVNAAGLIQGINDAIERQERTVPWWGDGYP